MLHVHDIISPRIFMLDIDLAECGKTWVYLLIVCPEVIELINA